MAQVHRSLWHLDVTRGEWGTREAATSVTQPIVLQQILFLYAKGVHSKTTLESIAQ